MKRILIIQGGGRRNGNTSQLVEAFANGARDAGHQTEVVSLQKYQVNGCIGCNACRYGKPCVQKDDFNTLIPKIRGGRSAGICIALVLLDDFFKTESFY
jgi:multimeric flavodoxin WrbA